MIGLITSLICLGCTASIYCSFKRIRQLAKIIGFYAGQRLLLEVIKDHRPVDSELFRKVREASDALDTDEKILKFVDKGTK